MTLRVCLVAPLPPPYGGISHWTQMISRYANECTDVDLRVLNTAPTWRDIHDTVVWKRALGGAVQLVRDMLVFLVVLFGWRPAAVHLTTSGQLALVRDVVVLLFARMMRVQTVYHIRFGRIPEILKNQSREAPFFRAAASLAHCIIAIDQATYDALVERFGVAKVSLIPNCYDPATLPAATTAQRKQVVFLGWVIPTKGVEELVDAWNLCLSDGWTLCVIGPGDAAYIEGLQRRVTKGNVEFFGQMNHADAMLLLSEASIFVLPSHTEGFPNVVLEAMAMGKAVVATEVGAIPEMLGRSRGVLIPKKNISKLADALQSLMSDTVLCEKLGSQALEYAVSKYSIQPVFSSYIDLWRAKLKP